ncbi:MAG: DUF1080 domain-containing protein [Bryobacterales bacterium]|nr:DUF1080 domain-containing protein [Bryobacterales bacterium]
MKLSIGPVVLLCGAALFGCAADGGWVRMFDGETLEGWKANERPDNWTLEDGAIKGTGERSHLYWMVEQCGDCEFKADVKTTPGSNSGMYFRAQWTENDWPKGYEAQVNNSHKDWRRTGSLYSIADVKEQLVPDDTWWTQHITVRGDHIVIQVNGKAVVDYVDPERRFMRGYLALQQHDPGSTVWYRNLMYRKLEPGR